MKIFRLFLLISVCLVGVSSAFSALLPPVPSGLTSTEPRLTNTPLGAAIDQVYNDENNEPAIRLRFSTLNADREAAANQLKAFKDPNYMNVMNSFPNSVYRLEESNGVSFLYDERNGTSRVKRIEENIIVDVLYHNAKLAQLKSFVDEIDSNELKKWAEDPSTVPVKRPQPSGSGSDPAQGSGSLSSVPGGEVLLKSVDSYRNAILKVARGIPVHRNLDIQTPSSDTTVVGAVTPQNVGAPPVDEDRWANVGARASDSDDDFDADEGVTPAPKTVHTSLKEFVPLNPSNWRIISTRTKKVSGGKGYKFKYRSKVNDAAVDGRIYNEVVRKNEYFRKLVSMKQRASSQQTSGEAIKPSIETRGNWNIYYEIPGKSGYKVSLNATDGTKLIHLEGHDLTKQLLFDLFNAFDLEAFSAFATE